jgi:protein TBF1
MSTKRRRSSEDDEPSAWEGAPLTGVEAQQHFPNYGLEQQKTYPEGQISASHNGTGNVGYTGAPQDTVGPSLGDSSDSAAQTSHQQQWSSTLGNAYPDVASYSQPYFHQQTDPSTYLSSWPPADASNAVYNDTASFNAGTTTAQSMPYFPTSSAADQANVYDAAGSSSFSALPPTDPAAQVSYGDAQPQVDAPASGSALYLEDASMHLKLQSLSILDNLVRRASATGSCIY